MKIVKMGVLILLLAIVLIYLSVMGENEACTHACWLTIKEHENPGRQRTKDNNVIILICRC